jgi:hypothetical protein
MLPLGMNCPLLLARLTILIKGIGKPRFVKSVSILVTYPSKVMGLWGLVNSFSYKNGLNVWHHLFAGKTAAEAGKILGATKG